MRLTPDLIRGAPAYMNPLKERELSLRGYKISKIENLGVTEDQYDVIDLSDNEILKLENFPLLQRLQALLLNNNRLCRIAKGLEEFLPRLVTLILTGNKLTNLSDIDNLSTLPRLTQLSLLNNPVTKQESYRLYVIHKFPKLKVLDFRKIKPKERKEAVKIFGVLEEDTKGEKDSTKTSAKTFVVGDGVPQTQTQTQTKKKGLTSDQKRKIMEAIKKATSLGEIERLEKILSSGKIPSDFDLDPTQPKETKSISVSESENNTDPSQTGSKKNPDEDSSEPKAEIKQDSKGTDAKAEKNKGKDSSAGEKEKSEKATPKGGEEGNPVEGEGETEGLADQEADEETDTSTRWEKADAQVDIEMAE